MFFSFFSLLNAPFVRSALVASVGLGLVSALASSFWSSGCQWACSALFSRSVHASALVCWCRFSTLWRFRPGTGQCQSVPHSSGWVLSGRATSVRLGLVRSCLVRYPSGLVWPGLPTALFWSVLFDSSQFSTVRSSPVHWQPCSIRGPAEPALLGSGRRQSSSVLASADRLGSSALLCPALILLLMVNP